MKQAHLEARRPIWFGGKDRSEASMDEFYQSLNSNQQNKIELAVMDMWKAFKNSANKNIPHAAIIYDKFHIMCHLNDALDQVRKNEFKRLTGQNKKYIKGNKFTLLSNKENLSSNGKKMLKKLLKVNIPKRKWSAQYELQIK